MNPTHKKIIIAVVAVLVALDAVIIILYAQFREKSDKNNNAGLANPASANCLAKNGILEIRKNKDGEYGVCLFEDNRQCEEWALYRGDCPAGGLKITGYENEAQVYCAITGGIVEGVGTATPMCKRIDGTYCNAEANFNGDCPDPNNPNPGAGNIEVPSSGQCGVANCHGIDIECGTPVQMCTEMYQLGDKCRQYAKCGVVSGTCQQIESPEFTACKSCAQKCENDFPNNPDKAFICESQCGK